MTRALGRRGVLAGSAMLSATSPLSGRILGVAFAAKEKEEAPTKNSPEEWMSAWMNKAKDVEGGLFVGRFVEPIYFLTNPITWKPNPGQEQYKPVTAPVGFVTDFASIPRVFWSLLRPDGEYAYAAVIHDYLYWTQDRPRETADTIFKFAMQDFSVGTVSANAIYRAVRVGGSGAWNGDSQLKAAGEKRILRRLPDDPRTRWEDWKKRPDVF
jgi:uncharacterized protein DUF1353